MHKTILSYYKYLFSIKKSESIMIIIDVALFIVAVIVFIGDLFATINAQNKTGLQLITILIIIKSLYEFARFIAGFQIDAQKKFANYLPHENSKCRIVSGANQKFRIEEYTISGKGNHVAISDEINDVLLKKYEEKDFKIEMRINHKVGKAIRRYISGNWDNLSVFLSHQYREARYLGRDFFNEKKLCISTDIEVKADMGLLVECHKGSYYDTFLTNIIGGKQLISNSTGKVIASAESTNVLKKKGDEYEIKGISGLTCNNEIGISTLAITNDFYLLILKQNSKAQSSSNLFVPSGSGSADWNDLGNRGFYAAITYAMNRELCEENTIKSVKYDDDNVVKTIITGYFRWIEKNGKPEFTGVTMLNESFNNLIENTDEVYGKNESLYLGEDKSKWASILAEFSDSHKDKCSVPLRAAISCGQKLFDNTTDAWVTEFLSQKPL